MNSLYAIYWMALIAFILGGSRANADSPKEAMDSLTKAIREDAHETVQRAAGALWAERFHALGFSNLADLSSGILESGVIEIDYSETMSGGGEYALFICSIVTTGENPMKYMSSMLWVKEPAGWRFLNLPFKDYTLPPVLSVAAEIRVEKAAEPKKSGNQ